MLFVIGIDHIDYPQLRGFNIAGGVQVMPELVALWAGLTIYAAAFIAEIVRARSSRCTRASARRRSVWA